MTPLSGDGRDNPCCALLREVVALLAATALVVLARAAPVMAQMASGDLPLRLASNGWSKPDTQLTADSAASSTEMPTRGDAYERALGYGSNESGQLAEQQRLGVAGNPAAVNIQVGTGLLGQWLGIDPEGGWRLGGVWVGDASGVLSGGVSPGEWGLNQLTVVDLSLDAEKRYGWTGTSFGSQFLQYNGSPTNSLAGTVQGFDGLQASQPFDRTELYQLWWRQLWFDGKLITRLGKSVPTYDFGNVLSAVPVDDVAASIPAVSSLIYTPIFVNPTMYARIPGYYDSATGITATYTPNEHIYVSYGFYDGNVAQNEATGERGPQFNGNYFHIGEVGLAWRAGAEAKPGKLGVGVWGQTGNLALPSGGHDHGETGTYLYASQRLWFRNPGVDNSGVVGFVQFGANDSNSSWVRQFYGGGLTAFGLMNSRPQDSFGIGLAYSVLNRDPNAGTFFFGSGPQSTPLNDDELMMAGYYQMHLWDGALYQPTLTYIPNPGERPGIPGAFAFSNYLILLF